MISLESITFNHDAASADHDALNIRVNASTAVTLPEWRKGVTLNPEDSPVAYALAPTKGHTLTVRATFRRSDPTVNSVTIRTFNPRDTRIQGCIYALLVKLGIIPIVRPPPPVLNALGEVKETAVLFGANDVVTVTLDLGDTQIWSGGVNVYDDTWQWQYRNSAGGWVDFQTSRHRAYVLLDVPTTPWTQAPYASTNTALPWIEVLDRACAWARGSTNADTAAGKVTESVYNLGPSVLEYDCPHGGSSIYSSGSFDCTAFLDRLRGGPGLGRYVNCSDCATIVSTFANALGCDLWQSRMYGPNSFALNALLAIGSNVWQTACGWQGFSYHEVAWKGGCTENDALFDACLQVDGDADPTSPPHVPLLPVNIVFGASGAGLYRDRLATPAGRANCQAQPTSRTRRTVH